MGYRHRILYIVPSIALPIVTKGPLDCVSMLFISSLVMANCGGPPKAKWLGRSVLFVDSVFSYLFFSVLYLSLCLFNNNNNLLLLWLLCLFVVFIELILLSSSSSLICLFVIGLYEC